MLDSATSGPAWLESGHGFLHGQPASSGTGPPAHRLTDGASDETKARYAFVYGDFRRLHRMGVIACMYRAAEWRHKEVELAAHELLQYLDKRSG